MLSQKNIDKIHQNGLYRHKPEAKWRGKLYNDNLYWCCNGTFRPVERNGVWYMRDTYWSSGNCVCVELTDENFDGFEFIFDFDDVTDLGSSGRVVEEYDRKDWFLAPIDSGGINFKHYFLRKGAKPSFHRKKESLLEEVASARRHLEFLEHQVEQLEAEYAANPAKYNE